MPGFFATASVTAGASSPASREHPGVLRGLLGAVGHGRDVAQADGLAVRDADHGGADVLGAAEERADLDGHLGVAGREAARRQAPVEAGERLVDLDERDAVRREAVAVERTVTTRRWPPRTVTCATRGWRTSSALSSSAICRSCSAVASFDQSVYAATGTSSIPRGATTGGRAPGGRFGWSSASFAWTRTTAWSGSVPTRKRTMTIPPDGCEVE